MSGYKFLDDDHDRYQDAYRNGFSRIAMKDVVLKEVTQHFDNNVLENMTHSFPADDQFHFLGLGVGEGQHELHFLNRLGSYFTSITNVAVDPNEILLEHFKSNAAAWHSGGKSKRASHWFHGPMLQFFDESPLAKCKYNMISAIHSLYYANDIETTFTRLMSMLKDKGIMFLVFTGCNLIYETHHHNPWLPANDDFPEISKSEQVLELAQRHGYTVTTSELDIKWDLTDLFDEQSEIGDRLADFLTMTAYVRKTAPAEKLGELLSFWRSSCSEDEDGRLRTLAGETIIVVSK